MSHVLSAGLRTARCDLGIIAMPLDFPPNPFLVHRFHGGVPKASAADTSEHNKFIDLG